MSFDPDDMAEISASFAQISKDAFEGYSVEFHVTKLGAKDMVAEWNKAMLGDQDCLFKCMENYSYIVSEIIEALKLDD
jgi:hypothetical protein